MNVKSITDSIKLLDFNLSIPVKKENASKLGQNEPIGSALNYLSKAYSESIWKSSKNQSNETEEQENVLNTNFQTSLFSIIELIYGYSVVNSCYTKQNRSCPHLLSKYFQNIFCLNLLLISIDNL